MSISTEFLISRERSYTVLLVGFLTLSFCRISYVDLFFQSLIFTSGCCSSSEALGVLDCLLTFECFGRSSSSKLLNTGALKNKNLISSWFRKYFNIQVSDHCYLYIDLLFCFSDAQEVKLFNNCSRY